MSDVNPYQAPSSDVAVAGETSNEPAGRWSRLGASIIDTIIMVLVVAPIMYLAYFTQGKEPPAILTLVAGVFVFVAINYIPLKKSGQTIGKKLLGIRITDMQGNQADVETIILKRYLPVQLVSQIPGIGGIVAIVDVLYIFREDRRCAHDLIAGTKVMRVK